jgi:hypothetical protein
VEVLVARKNLGLPAGVSADGITVGYFIGAVPGHSSYYEISSNLVIPLPASPSDHQMELFEISAIGPVVVSCPPGTLLTGGTTSAISIPGGKTVFMGFRYSAHAMSWFLLSSAVQS